MINEPITLEDNYFALAGQVIEYMNKTSLFDSDKIVIGICGESGSGKSTTAQCLQIELERRQLGSVILHQDNYYKLSPLENQNKRKSDLSWVGENEVHMDLIQDHINQFRVGVNEIESPVVNYTASSFSKCILDLKGISVLIVEGVYSFGLSMFDFRVFMERTYEETFESRKRRNREKYDTFVEEVLKIEHTIVSQFRNLSDVVITKDYQLINHKK